MNSLILVLSLVLVPCLSLKCQDTCLTGYFEVDGVQATISDVNAEYPEAGLVECSDATVKECSDGLHLFNKIIIFPPIMYVL